MIRRAFLALAASVLVATAADELLAQESRPLPSVVEFLQTRIAEDSATIARLLDELAKARAEAAELREKLKADNPKD